MNVLRLKDKDKIKFRMKSISCFIFLSFIFVIQLSAQTGERKEKLTIEGHIVTALITETDTFIVADLDEMSVSSLRTFSSKEEKRRYRKYRYAAQKVYPFANESIKLFREVEYVTQNMKKKKRKKHIKRLHKQLKKEFKPKLKKLSKTQGKVLVKMIERELDVPFYKLIKDLRGGLTASFWHNIGKINGYDLKQKYKEGDDPILDIVLQDFNISHEVVKKDYE